MRILQLGKFYPILGGVEKVMMDLTTGLSEAGIDCDMMCATAEPEKRCAAGASAAGSTDSDNSSNIGDSNNNSNSNNNSGADDVSIFNLNAHGRVIVCRTWMKKARTTIAPAMVAELRRRVNEYDIVHIHHPDPMAALALMLSGFKGKVILHWHSDILAQKVLLKFYLPIQKWLIGRADLILGTSPVYLAESPFLLKVQDKTRCLPIGIPPMKEDKADAARIRNEYAGRKIVFTLGRLVEYKGYRYLIDAAAHLDDSFVVLIGGSGPLKAELQRQIDSLGLGNRVKLLGRVSDEDLPACYSACDLFCLSSIMKTEAFGIVQIEAMSLGKPVVATKIPASGVSWGNQDGVSGLNVEPCDAPALAEAIKAVTKDEATWNRFSEGARNRFLSTFTKEKMISNCLNFYSELLSL